MTGYGARHSRDDAALVTRPIPLVAAARAGVATVAGPRPHPGSGGVHTAMPVHRGGHGRQPAVPAPRPVPQHHRVRPATAVPPGAPGRSQPAATPPSAPPAAGGGAPASPGPMLLEQLGGVSGMVASVLPSLTFVVAQAAFGASLPVCVGVAVGVALAFVAWRHVRGEALRPALSGVVGVLVSALIVLLTGEAANFYLLGIVGSGLGFVAFLVSVLVGRPLVGVTWHALTRRAPRWWTDPRMRRAFAIASWTWVVVFGARVAVQGLLYSSVHAEAWLGWARLAMGLPLTAVAAAATVWAVRRAGRG